jgi:ribonuclease J
MTFAGPEAPGVDIVLPDLAFIEERRKDLLAIIITHAHEDHIGALATFWPKLRAPVYCTAFAAGLICRPASCRSPARRRFRCMLS